jgi:hypothetical protein
MAGTIHDPFNPDLHGKGSPSLLPGEWQCITALTAIGKSDAKKGLLLLPICLSKGTYRPFQFD